MMTATLADHHERLVVVQGGLPVRNDAAASMP